MSPEMGGRFGKLTVVGAPVSRNSRRPCRCNFKDTL